MEVCNAAQAREWLNAWGNGAFELNRANRLADDMDTCAGLGLDRNSEAARGYREAAEVLRDAVARQIAPIVNESVLTCATVLLHVFFKIENEADRYVTRF